MKNYYDKRRQEFLVKQGASKKEANLYSIFRGIAFLLSVALLITYFQIQNNGFLIFSMCSGIGFYFLVLHHRKLESMVKYYGAIVEINLKEAKRQQLELSEFATGEEYLENDHPYQNDLDILGQSSLFQLINRCQIRESSERLSTWLSHPAEEATILDRQEAVKELAAMPEWNQDFMATIKLQLSEKEKRAPSVSHEHISAWTSKAIEPIRSHVWKWTAILLSIVFMVAGVLVFMDQFPYQILYLPAILNVIFLSFGLRRLKQIITGIDNSHYLIASYEKAISLLEKSDFSSKRLLLLRNNLLDGSSPASKSIARLALLTNRIASRSNMLYALLDIPLLLDIHLLSDLFQWKKDHKDDIDVWFDTIHELECLISLGCFAHANPQYQFPKVSSKAFQFTAKDLGHPLIPEKESVANDYFIDGEGKTDIITGSNMSGKSTFQRTVGVNMVLAQSGAPVNASSLTMGTTAIFTSMRTRDNLAENTSSFYAELKRIRQLLDTIEQNTSTFFLLDEILKGTNSEDRHRGAIALVKKLTKKKAFGMISTHDLTLSNLEQSEKNVRNYSFNSSIEGDEILFDYQLTPGPCRSFNASKLMEKMGIM